MARDSDVFQLSLRTVPQDQLAYEEFEEAPGPRDLHEHKKGINDGITKPDCGVHHVERMLPARMAICIWTYQEVVEDWEDHLEDEEVPTDYAQMDEQLAYEEFEEAPGPGDLHEHKKGINDGITKPDCAVHQVERMLPARMAICDSTYLGVAEDWEDHLEDEEVPTDDAEMDEQMEFGEIRSPNVEQLTEALKPDGGKPPSLRARPWCCDNCKDVYRGDRNFICDTHKYKCYDCNIKNPTSHSWTLTRVKLNGVSLNFIKVYLQMNNDRCILCSFLALCDMTRRIRGAKRGADESMPFDDVALSGLYREAAGFEVGEPNRKLNRSRSGQHEDIEIILKVAVQYGVPYSGITMYDKKHKLPAKPLEGVRIPLRSLKVKGWFRINKEQIDYIMRVLGHGYPLMAVVPVGKCFKFLPNGQVYHTPLPQGCAAHSIVLHGWANQFPECDLAKDAGASVNFVPCEVYYRCRNSHGSKSHPDYEKGGEGADFNVWATDIVGDVYGIDIYDFD